MLRELSACTLPNASLAWAANGGRFVWAANSGVDLSRTEGLGEPRMELLQLYISSQPGETHQIEKLMECIVDIKNWMANNFLLLNSEKTEVLIIGPKNHKSNNLEHCLTLDGCSLDSSSSVRNLGVLFDSNLSFDSHVSSICKSAFFSF